MAGTRTVYRGSKGRFAGASAGKAERVRAGGFAHAGFRSRVLAQRAATKGNARPPAKGGSGTGKKTLTATQRRRRSGLVIGGASLALGAVTVNSGAQRGSVARTALGAYVAVSGAKTIAASRAPLSGSSTKKIKR